MSAARSLVEASLFQLRELYAAASSRQERAAYALKEAEREEQGARMQCHRLVTTIQNLENVLTEDGVYLEDVPL